MPSWATDAARSSNVHSLRGRVDLSSSSAIGSGMAGQVGLGRGQVLVEVVDDVEGPVHPPPVAGIGADVRIDAGLRGGGEAELLGLARLEQAAGQQDLAATPGRIAAAPRRAGGRRLGQQADLLEGAGLASPRSCAASCRCSRRRSPPACRPGRRSGRCRSASARAPCRRGSPGRPARPAPCGPTRAGRRARAAARASPSCSASSAAGDVRRPRPGSVARRR